MSVFPIWGEHSPYRGCVFQIWVYHGLIKGFRKLSLFKYVYAKTQLVIDYDSKVRFFINYPEWFSTVGRSQGCSGSCQVALND